MASVRDPPTLREERKVVTALFADLVGSTAVGARFDPEDAREIVSGGVAPMIEAIERYGGTIKDLAGDGVLALFGAPVSHEDDVERAVLAGLAISSALSEYGDDVALRWGHEGLDVRVGIETGLAVLGPVGAGGRIEYGAVGDVLNTAARLQSAARPGAVLVGEGARREVAGLFDWEPPSALALKGKDEPVVASVALRPSDPRARAAATRRPDPVFVGRAAEIAAVDEALSALAGGAGSAIFVIGEPGIGKSRLVAEARRRALSGRYGSPVRWLEARCLSYAENVPYGLFRDLFAGSVNLPGDDRADHGLPTVGSDPALAIDPADITYLELVLAGRADSPNGDDAEALRDRVFATVESTLLRLASSGPVVISLEDLHWSDPTSLALTERLLASVARAPLVVLATLRPEPGHPSTAMIRAAADLLGSRARTIALGSLSLGEGRALLASLPGANAVPDAIRRVILEATDGNPFFLEEQVTSLANTGRLILDPDRGWRFEGDATLDIPRSVERLLIAQIDRLDADAKDVLVAASVLGREFAPEVLTRVVGEEADVGPTLVKLERLDLLRRERRDSDVGYRFRHALIQEAAYRSLLKRARRDLHGRAAAAIEASHEGRSETVAGALGHHLLQAGEMARAVPHLMTAGDRAREVFANEEAFTWYERALEAIDAMTGAERKGWNAAEADLHARRGEVLELAGRFQAAREAYRRSIELAASGDPLRLAQIRTDAALIEISDHRYDEGLAELDRAERELGRIADTDPPDPERMSVWFEIQDARMAAFYWLDHLSAYAELIERVRPFVESHGTPQQRARFFETLLTFALRRSRYVVDEEMLGYAHANVAASDEAGVASGAAWARFNLGFTLLWAGRFDEARALLTESLQEGDRMGDRTLVSRARTYLMVVGRRQGDERVVERSIDQVIASAREVSLSEYEAMALANRSWVHARAGRTSEAEADASAALELWRSLPVRYPFDWMALWPLIGIELDRGGVPEAVALARDMFADHQQPLPAELRSQLELGIEAWDADDPDRAEREFGLALALATRLAYA